jgi:integrase
LKKLNPNTINDYILKLNTILISAKNEYNLISEINLKKLIFNKVKADKNKRALNIKEEEQIITDLKNDEDFLIILIALKCGLRLGEILGLTWRNIDIKNAIIKVTQQWKKLDNGECGLGTLKTKNSYREVPIPESIMDNFKEHSAIKYMDKRVFANKSTNNTSGMINAKLKKYNITIHELRHTYATKLIANGMDFKTVAQLLGHDVQETYKTYSHVNDDMKKRAANLINKIL